MRPNSNKYLNNLVQVKTIKKQKTSRDQEVNTTPSIIMVPMWYMWDTDKSLSNNTEQLLHIMFPHVQLVVWSVSKKTNLQPCS